MTTYTATFRASHAYAIEEMEAETPERALEHFRPDWNLCLANPF